MTLPHFISAEAIILPTISFISSIPKKRIFSEMGNPKIFFNICLVPTKEQLFKNPIKIRSRQTRIASAEIKWGSVIYFPTIVYDIATELEELVPYAKNPLGAFVGLTFPVKYTYRTAQSPIMESFKLNAEAQASAPSAVRNMLQETHK